MRLDRLAGEQPFGLFYTVDVTSRIKDWNTGRTRMSQLACNELIDRQLYPIDDLENPKRASAIAAARATLREDGCAVIRGFFSDSGLAALHSEAFARKAKAYYSENKACNVYLGNGNPERPDDHPQNIFMDGCTSLQTKHK